MKKIISLITSLVLILGMVFSPKSSVSYADNEEVRAAWVASVFNIDWPSKGSQGNPEKQKSEFIHMIDRLKGAGINTVILQVRPESDTLYKSDINPWSRFLTGTQGKNPGYDPLAFAVQECHKRNMKIEAWLNPYRANLYSDRNNVASNHVSKQHPEWVIGYKNKWYYDPGLPQVRRYIVDTVNEVVSNYDIDGIQFDDYFYPASDFPDQKTYDRYSNGMERDDWRRNNVNMMLRDVHDSIKRIKPNVKFGVSPAGIWRNRYNDKNGSNTSGGESYIKQYADTRYWIKNHLVDYVCPQVYWRIGHPKADYETLIKWWSDQVKGTGVKLYIGQGIYKHGQNEYAGENVAREIKDQLIMNRKYPEISGSIFFSARDILNIPQVYNDLKSLYTESDSGNLGDIGTRLPYKAELAGKDRAETAIKVSQRGWPEGADTVVLVDGGNYVAGVMASPLAAKENAPILLSFTKSSMKSTLKEIKRLNPSKIISIGDSAYLNELVDNVKKQFSGIKEKRIDGKDNMEMSLNIAETISGGKELKSLYIASEEALPDVLSIASKAGYEKQPVLITSKNNISDSQKEYIKKSNPSNIYFIGGPKMIDDSIIQTVSNIVDRDLSENRVYGSDRVETNSKVIEKFYKNSFFKKAFLTRADAPIDAITVSAFAQRTDSPLILVKNSVSALQKNTLAPKSASLVYRIGGGINETSYKIIYSLLGGSME